jgi:hypothetical protein
MLKDVRPFSAGDELLVAAEWKTFVSRKQPLQTREAWKTDYLYAFKAGAIYRFGTSFNFGGEEICTVKEELGGETYYVNNTDLVKALYQGWAGIVGGYFSAWVANDCQGNWMSPTGYDKCFYLGAAIMGAEEMIKKGTVGAAVVRLYKAKWTGAMDMWSWVRPKKGQIVSPGPAQESREHAYSPYVVRPVLGTTEKERFCTACGAGEKTSGLRACLGVEGSGFDLAMFERETAKATASLGNMTREENLAEVRRFRMESFGLRGLTDDLDWKLMR